MAVTTPISLSCVVVAPLFDNGSLLGLHARAERQVIAVSFFSEYENSAVGRDCRFTDLNFTFGCIDVKIFSSHTFRHATEFEF